ncbi:hypothetical protein [Bifidobacterium tsurumiense]|uniref:hypothetical protein n=1 Tax=Bifidobacterium tsurumiense TaxID=356829 RepID=UPI001E368239|nr:hypothetical protein [Bifidobacterium tsurumiense]MDY4678449.1 hypothetical protein [Bifidobacterium tsurumiense]
MHMSIFRRHASLTLRTGRTTLFALLVALLAIASVEIIGFNMPLWSTLSASTDSGSASNTLGSGLQQRDDGLLEITDPTQAFLEVEADGSSSYARIDPYSSSDSTDQNSESAAKNKDIVKSLYVRADSDGIAGKTQSVDVRVPRSLYVHSDAQHTIRLWIQEPAGSLIPISAIRANVRVPFQIDWLRVAAMIGVLVLIMLLRPHSLLWNTPLDTKKTSQRLLFAVALLPFALMSIFRIIWLLRFSQPSSFHVDGGYTYDFDQYGHLADALIHGHTWLDLPVPQALAQADTPYDTAVRDQLLAQGTTPIYWDYAFYEGHWYSYFGVLPAILLFIPYRLLSPLLPSLNTSLPSDAAVLFLMFGFLVFGSLLIIRIVHMAFPHASLAFASIALALFAIGSNSYYLWFRTNFYSVPISASLLLSSLGLWLWLGVYRPRCERDQNLATAESNLASQAAGSGKARGIWTVPGATPISLPHLASGAFCIAANVGCRPAFALVALVGLPLFSDQLFALIQALKNRSISVVHAFKPILAVTIPAVLITIPLAWYNMVRFGSPLNFGNAYQLTVTDMTAHHTDWASVIPTLGYYLLLPLRLTNRFPGIGISPTPLPQWGYAEPMVAGIVVLCPFLALAAAIPLLRKYFANTLLWNMLTACLGIGTLILVVDSIQGGIGWRYIADFAWLLAIPAIGTLAVMLGEHRRKPLESSTLQQSDLASRCEHIRSSDDSRLGIGLWVLRCIVVVILLYSIVITAMSGFVSGRDDAMLRSNPELWHRVASWFLPLL